MDNCSIAVVTETRIDDNMDSELCLISEGLEVSNELRIV